MKNNNFIWLVVVIILTSIIAYMFWNQNNMQKNRMKRRAERMSKKDKFGPWSHWSNCSVECGGGIQQRNRDCMGDDCNGPYTQTRACNTNPCIQQTYYIPQSLYYPRRFGWGWRRRGRRHHKHK